MRGVGTMILDASIYNEGDKHEDRMPKEALEQSLKTAYMLAYELE
jgi:hypothetical protein